MLAHDYQHKQHLKDPFNFLGLAVVRKKTIFSSEQNSVFELTQPSSFDLTPPLCQSLLDFALH